jgi:hypothetical protein
LVTFTPCWWNIVIFCDYSILSEDSRKYTHFQRHQSVLEVGNTESREASTENQDVVEQQWQPPLFFNEPESPCGGSGLGVIPLKSHRGPCCEVYYYRSSEGRIRHNLMMTVPSNAGILVALNPTDEGRIGTGRNT